MLLKFLNNTLVRGKPYSEGDIAEIDEPNAIILLNYQRAEKHIAAPSEPSDLSQDEMFDETKAGSKKKK
jgi:hypothetical protein